MSNQTRQILELMDEMRQAGRDFCAVTVVRTANATSAKAGAKAIVTDDGVAGAPDPPPPPPPHAANARAARDAAAGALRTERVVRMFMSPSRMR